MIRNCGLFVILGFTTTAVLAACNGGPTATTIAPQQPIATAEATTTLPPTATPMQAPQSTSTPGPAFTPTTLATPMAPSTPTPTPIPTPLPAKVRAVVLIPSKDSTLYENSDGNLSNGSGQHLFAGNNAKGVSRRSVIAFDVVGSVPTGAKIISAELTLNMSRATGAAHFIELHTLTSDWGEGVSNADSQEGGGTASIDGDVTWLHRRFDSTSWRTPGGDFSDTISGVISIDDPGLYTWSSTHTMVVDIQNWLDDPSINFGWLLLGEENLTRTAKRFDSKESSTSDNRPKLAITYELHAPN